MDQFIVPQVKAPVNGEVEISGAKNAVLAVMAAELLADGVSEITNVPHLKDMKTMSDVLRVIGCHINGGSGLGIDVFGSRLYAGFLTEDRCFMSRSFTNTTRFICQGDSPQHQTERN